MQNAGTPHQFGRFVLDVERGTLSADGVEVPLRPKTFAVLLHLVQNAGRLISKDKLLAAVWPNIIVTDDTLVQSIGELRRALSEEGAAMIVTVPRRGYRFDPAAQLPAGTVEQPAPNRWKLAIGLAGLLILVAAGLWLILLAAAQVISKNRRTRRNIGRKHTPCRPRADRFQHDFGKLSAQFRDAGGAREFRWPPDNTPGRFR